LILERRGFFFLVLFKKGFYIRQAFRETNARRRKLMKREKEGKTKEDLGKIEKGEERPAH
jgi:hypothetical protein